MTDLNLDELERLMEQVQETENALFSQSPDLYMDDGFATAATLSQFIDAAIENYAARSICLTPEMKLQALALSEKDIRTALGGDDETW